MTLPEVGPKNELSERNPSDFSTASQQSLSSDEDDDSVDEGIFDSLVCGPSGAPRRRKSAGQPSRRTRRGRRRKSPSRNEQTVTPEASQQ
eukprot:CAMPEP_0168739440 /NCGR_PEP_ID=MMETSP0724-20121128/11465_1 /TAXON_ID=265536 /ORGANISM="Amphiprora sp., Strain CCMP467" /LENGTH=89 /DNA_ID=CAMNT_0008786845 /DNA_START=75 /DNA_END=344 /DNA_ORIENTATION=+